MKRPYLWLLGSALAILLAVPYMLNLAGDAQVHLAVAENFVAGRPFQYNPNGELVVASTSPFWTMQLAFFYRLAGDAAPLLLSLIAAVIWLASAYVLFRAAKDAWRLPALGVVAVVALWLLHTTIVANALGGLENVLAALQLLLLYVMTSDYLSGPVAGQVLTPGRSALLGLVLGWALLTRPDGGLLALGLLGVFALALWPRPSEANFGRRLLILAGQMAIVAGVAFLVLAPWYLYQVSLTGQLVTDSSLARLYNGRLGSLALISGSLYLHPKALVSIASAFAPLAAGFLVTLGVESGQLFRARGERLEHFRLAYSSWAALALVVGGVFFYTFVVGAEAFGRYFLPLFPFLFLAGVAGWVFAWNWLHARGWRTIAVAGVTLAMAFMVATSVYDGYRRLGPGRFTSDRILNVIYGPANRQYYSVNLPALLAAPEQRAAQTEALREALGAEDGPLAIAVTEVQLRYFVDETVDVLSLDGRTSADVLTYVDPVTGVPDFTAYLSDVRPDYVHAAQWCEVGGWLADLRATTIEDNLICLWEQQAATMSPGETFTWQNRPVTLVAPQILRIDW